MGRARKTRRTIKSHVAPMGYLVAPGQWADKGHAEWYRDVPAFAFGGGGDAQGLLFFTFHKGKYNRLCCTNPVRDSPCESSVVAGGMSRPNTPSYKTLNWPEYNKALKGRGSLTIWFDPDMI